MKNKKGFILTGVVLLLLFLLIIVPVMVKWVQIDSKLSVKDQKSTLAFNLAEAAVDRGYWKVKSSTSILTAVSDGVSLTGYNFDTFYTDISGGSYRIKIASGTDIDTVVVYGEGRDSAGKETRALKAVFTVTSIPGAILSSGQLTADYQSEVHWGPIMSKGDIVLTAATGHTYPSYPRKISMQTVKPRDPTGDTNPPNTDSLEWWSNYNVPDLPIFDFVTMKASAAATGTLNCNDVFPETYTYTYTPCTGLACATGTNCACARTCTGLACVKPPTGTCSCGSKTCTGSACLTYDCVCTGSGSSKHCNGSSCVDSDGSSKNCACTGSGSGIVCTGKNCTDPTTNCSCTGSGASKVCTGSNCFDPGANCDCGYTCTGLGCTDSDGAGTDCGCSQTCTGIGCADTDGSATGCACTVNVTTTTATTAEMRCCHSDVYGGEVTCDYGNGVTTACTDCAVADLFHQKTMIDKDYTWYWDNNITLPPVDNTLSWV